jgi:hypothetical protein
MTNKVFQSAFDEIDAEMGFRLIMPSVNHFVVTQSMKYIKNWHKDLIARINNMNFHKKYE